MKSSHLATDALILVLGRLKRADLTFCPFMTCLPPSIIICAKSTYGTTHHDVSSFKKGCSTNLQKKTFVSAISQQKNLIHRAKRVPSLKLTMSRQNGLSQKDSQVFQPSPPMTSEFTHAADGRGTCFIDITSHDNKPSVRQSCR